MATTAFNTRKAVKTLKDAGVTAKGADAHIKVIEEVTEGLATKEDLRSLEERVDLKLKSLEDRVVNRLTATMWRMQFMTLVMTLGAGFAALKFVLDKVAA